MDQISETKRLAEAVANIAATITGIIDARMQSAAAVLEQRIAQKTIEPLLSKRQVAEQLNVTARTVDNWMGRGYLPYYRIGRNIRFRMGDIQDCLEAKCKVGWKKSRY